MSLSDYFRSHKSLGSHDRKTIGDQVYALVRWQSLFDVIDLETNFSKRLHFLKQKPINEWKKEEKLPLFCRLGLTPYLWNTLSQCYGPKTAEHLADVFNSPGPIFVRANLHKTTREELLRLWEGKFSVKPVSQSPAAIAFSKREPLFSLPEFKQGLFEVQDLGSQLVADLLDVKPGSRILDYCGGSGGKSLAFAPRMKGKGEIYLHDIRASALKEAALRFRRAGVQNASILPADHPTLKKLILKMDWVLVDVPCSGSGTLRRNPDMKWKIDEEMVTRLKGTQAAIFSEAYRYAKSGGRIVYATCSIFPEENEAQVESFLRQYDLELEKPPLKLLPEKEGSDGFFAAVFIKRRIR